MILASVGDTRHKCRILKESCLSHLTVGDESSRQSFNLYCNVGRWSDELTAFYR